MISFRMARRISMEYVNGFTLSAMKADQPERCFEAEAIAPWIQQLCQALEYAHTDAKVVHRDLKPANLMINSKGVLKITDFGIAQSLSESASRLTVGTGTAGTLVYMSPQQANGAKPTAADDIYSL